jgi:GGDEF domain-containing protein
MGVDDLAKGWLLALLEQAPLDQAAGILAVDLTRDGPRICDAVVRALADDLDLRRLEQGGALEPLVARVADIAGADTAEAAARAVDALQAVVWSALRAELPWPDPDQISDLAERLALVCERVRAAALRRPLAGTESRPAGGAPTFAERSAPAPLRVTRVSEPEAAEVGETAPSSAEPGPLWVAAIADEIRQSEHSGTPLSLLLAELEDSERVESVEPAAETSATFGHFAQAVRSVVRREDLLVCETPTRAWIIARETARAGALALGSRIAEAVEQAPSWRGAPLAVSVGVAVLGEDGTDAVGLIEAAEEARFAAAATGVRVMPQNHGETPPEAG